MDQLVKAANQRISELKIKPSHHKAQSKLTSRTVRYYLQNGYIPEAIRMSGQISPGARDAVLDFSIVGSETDLSYMIGRFVPAPDNRFVVRK